MSADTTKAPMPNSYWVVPGGFAAGEYPGAYDEGDARAKIGMLLEAGITRFIDLTEAGLLSPYVRLLDEEAAALGAAVRHDRHAIVDGAVPSSRGAMAATLDAIDAAMSEGHVVYVHCRGGIGRTGTVVGCWLVRHGRTGDEALSMVAELFSGMAKAGRGLRSPETSRQEAYVRNWTDAAR